MTLGSISTENTIKYNSSHAQMGAKGLSRFVGKILFNARDALVHKDDDGTRTCEILEKNIVYAGCSCSDEVMMLVDETSKRAIDLLI